MDTRNKILTPPWPGFARPLVIVTGYFDVLRAEHVRDLQHARDGARAATLLAIVLPHPAALLPQRARAELVAALRAVDYVLIGEELAGTLHPDQLIRLEEADERRTRELGEHVRRKSLDA